MILVDTSIWIDHLHKTEAELVHLLARDEVGSHPLVVEELALGSLKARSSVISLLSALYRFPSVSHEEILDFVDTRRLWGRGLSAADVHLLGSVLLERGARLWTRDKRLRSAALDVGAVCLLARPRRRAGVMGAVLPRGPGRMVSPGAASRPNRTSARGGSRLPARASRPGT